MPGSLFVICQGLQPTTADKTVSTSPTAFTWTERAGALDGSATRIAYGNGIFVYGTLAFGSNVEAIQTSPNGITWTPRHSPADGGDASGVVRALIWVEELGLFVATYNAPGAGVMTSPDGITWTNHTIPSPGETWLCLAYSPELGLLVAPSFSAALVMTSPDGATWTNQTAPDFDWRAVAWGADLFVAFGAGFDGTGATVLMTSPDGINWTGQPDPGNQTIEAVIFANEQFVACGLGELTEDLLRVLTSPDGLTWTPQTTTARTWWALTYGLGRYVMVAKDRKSVV